MMVVVYLVLLCIGFAHSYKILAIFPFPSASHYAMPDPLLLRLAEKGHQVTVYNPFPKSKKMSNYNEVDISSCFSSGERSLSNFDRMHSQSGAYGRLWAVFNYVPVYDDFETCGPLMKLLNSTESYDLLITESFNTDVPLIFAKKFQIPFVTMQTTTMKPWLSRRMGNPDNPSCITNLVDEYEIPSGFVERLHSTIMYVVSLAMYDEYSLKKSEKVMRDVLGVQEDFLYQFTKRTSVVFVNTHFSLNALTPRVPGVIDVGGIHIKDAKPLPKVGV